VTDTDRRKHHASRSITGKRTTPLGVGHFGTGLGVFAMVGVLAACSGGGTGATASSSASPSASASASSSAAGPSPSASASPSASQPPADPSKVTCEYRKDDSGSPAKFVGYPPKKPTKAALNAKTMTIKTNLGDIVIALKPELTPCTVNSFAFLAKKNFFDNTVCHRLTTIQTNGLGVMQCGDPQAKGDGKNPTDGTGGPGYLFNDENLGAPYNRGVVFMAQGGDDANSNGSQFAISYSDDTAQLPAAYTPFGTLDAKGLAIIDKIVKGGVNTAPDGVDITSDTGGSNAPKIKVKIKDVVVS
jgi:peptidyl-prolyl cis-trans isomerase B (cyclophilin B)